MSACRSSRWPLGRLTGALLLAALAATGCKRAPGEGGDAALGERLYLRGEGAPGERLTAIVKGDLAIRGEPAACAACHQRSGFGALEGGVQTPAIVGSVLFAPLQESYRTVPVAGAAPRRPAYTEESLGALLQHGKDPAGRAVSPLMPRYQLSKEELRGLAAYLRGLDAAPSPGVLESELRVATIVTEEVPEAEREQLLYPLRKMFALKNSQTRDLAADHENRAARMLALMAKDRALGGKRLDLQLWTLTGSPEGWGAQLAALYAKAPPFAVVSGISHRSWAPVEAFCERERLPCLFPAAPVTGPATGRYTLYLGGGFQQEGEAGARYLASLGAGGPAKVVQVVRGSEEGRALAAGFERTFAQLSPQVPLQRLELAPGVAAEAASILAAAATSTAVLVWDGPEALPLFEALAAAPERPLLIGSGQWLGSALAALPERAQAAVRVTWPFRLPEDEARYQVVLHPWLGAGAQLEATTSRGYHLASAGFAAATLFSSALVELHGRFHRELLLETIAMMPLPALPSFEHPGLGPGQSVLSKGAYLARAGGERRQTLAAASAWLTH
jgi:hypothetical protein